MDIPFGLTEIESKYGRPDHDGDGICDIRWMATNLRIFLLPYPMRISWKPKQFVSKIQAHKLVGDAICDALEEAFKKVTVDLMRNNRWDYWGGCFNFRRNKHDPKKLSTHSWGIAVDLNPHLCPMGNEKDNQPREISEAFMERGFYWVPGDWMHAQACKGY